MDEQISVSTPQDLSGQPVQPYPKKLFVFIGLIILTLLIAGGIFFLNKKSTKNISAIPVVTLTLPTPTESVQANSSSPEVIINQISDSIKKDPELAPFLILPSNEPKDSYRNSLWWVSRDGWNILVEGVTTVILRIPESTVPTTVEPVKTSLSKKFQKLSAGVMKKNNLSLNALNSSSSETDKKYYDYIQAYDGPNIYCTILTNPDRFGDDSTGGKMVIEMRVNCVNEKKYQAAYDQQVPFLKGLNDKTGVLSNIKIKNDKVASMSLNWRRTGATAFMYKSGSDWKKIIIAQAVPECIELVKNNVPKEFWVECYDKDNNIQPKGSAWK